MICSKRVLAHSSLTDWKAALLSVLQRLGIGQLHSYGSLRTPLQLDQRIHQGNEDNLFSAVALSNVITPVGVYMADK